MRRRVGAFALVLLAVVAAGPARAQGRRWTPLNGALAATSSALILVDWGQTLAGRRLGYEESDPILGRTPSVGRVNTTIGLKLLANVGVGALLPTRWRNVLWGAVTTVEIASVLHNSLAIGFVLPFGRW